MSTTRHPKEVVLKAARSFAVPSSGPSGPHVVVPSLAQTLALPWVHPTGDSSLGALGFSLGSVVDATGQLVLQVQERVASTLASSRAHELTARNQARQDVAAEVVRVMNQAPLVAELVAALLDCVDLDEDAAADGQPQARALAALKAFKKAGA